MGLIIELLKDAKRVVEARKVRDTIVSHLVDEEKKNSNLYYFGLKRLGIRNAIYREERIYKELKREIWSKWKLKLIKKR